jgi:transcriptional regulator with XRE-family HTH domain
LECHVREYIQKVPDEYPIATNPLRTRPYYGWMTLGQRIDMGCRAKNWTRAELAAKAKVPTPQYVSRLVNGDRGGKKYIPGIAKALGCTVEWLTLGTGAGPSWAANRANDYAGALASLEAAAAIVKQVAAARKSDAKQALEGIVAATKLVRNLQ